MGYSKLHSDVLIHLSTGKKPILLDFAFSAAQERHVFGWCEVSYANELFAFQSTYVPILCSRKASVIIDEGLCPAGHIR